MRTHGIVFRLSLTASLKRHGTANSRGLNRLSMAHLPIVSQHRERFSLLLPEVRSRSQSRNLFTELPQLSDNSSGSSLSRSKRAVELSLYAIVHIKATQSRFTGHLRAKAPHSKALEINHGLNRLSVAHLPIAISVPSAFTIWLSTCCQQS